MQIVIRGQIIYKAQLDYWDPNFTLKLSEFRLKDQKLNINYVFFYFVSHNLEKFSNEEFRNSNDSQKDH